MARPFANLDTESALLDEVTQRRQRLSAQRRAVLPRSALLAASYADAYPWMDASAINSFVQAGVPADQPEVQFAGSLAARQAAADGSLDPQAEDVPDGWLGTLVDIVFGPTKRYVRAGFLILATPLQEVQALLSSAGVAAFDETDPAGSEQILKGDPFLGQIEFILRNLGTIVSDVADVPQLVSDFWTNYTEKAARSGGVLALSDLLAGNRVDIGEGFLPAGAIFEEREKAKQRLRIDNQFATPGRLIARQMVEPGTMAWQMVSGGYDFALNVADPVNIAFLKLSKAAKAARTFQATGVVSGLRKTVGSERAVEHYLTSPIGQRLVRLMTENTEFETAWRVIPDRKSALALSRTTNESATFDVLSDVLATVAREKPTAGFVSRQLGGLGGNEYGALFGGGARVRRAVDTSPMQMLGRLGRLGDDMPQRQININDGNDAMRQLDLWMRNANVPRAFRARRMAELALVKEGDEVGMLKTVTTIMDDVEGMLVNEWGISPEKAKKATSIFENMSDDLRTFDLDALGREVDVLAPLRLQVEGAVVDVRPMPGMISELVTEFIPLPDVRAIRRMTPTIKKWQKLFDSGLWKGSVDGLDGLMSKVWKPFQLLRLAYPMRVIGEEQLRMGASGYDSLFSNPISAIAWSLSIDPKSSLGVRLARAAKIPIGPKGTVTVSGALWDDIAEHTAALNRGSAGWRGLPGEVLTSRYVKARQGDIGFNDGWAVELAHESNDPIMRRVAEGLKDGDLRSIGQTSVSLSTFDDVAQWWWKGSGKTWRIKLGNMEGRSALLTDKGAADAYLRQNYFDRLERMTGGNTELVELVARGRLDEGTLAGINLRGFNQERKLSKVLEESFGDAAPNFVKTPETIRGSTAGGRTLAVLDRATERAFEGLMSRPTNYLSRSSTFRQAYWRRVEELLGSATGDVQTTIIKNARAANLGAQVETRMASQIVKHGAGSKLDNIDDVDTLAKAFALDETKKLLYDLQKRNQFFDMMRVVFPFGEAWKEIVTAWTRIVRQNPNVIRRSQQLLGALRQPSVFGEVETTPGSGEGFFHPDPQTGSEVFTYPGGAWVSKLLLGTDKAGVEFVGRAAGLNIASATVLPGFGPVVQYPVSKLLPNTPQWDDIRKLILPFGESESIGEAFTPAWMDKLKLVFGDPDPEQDRLFANTVADVQRALMRGGNYDLGSTKGQQKLFDDAVFKARLLYVIRGSAQFGVPTGPSLQWSTNDLSGTSVAVKMLSDDLRTLTETYGGDRSAAFLEWVRRYGVDNVLATIGKSTAIVDRPVTEKGDAWLRDHAQQERDFPMTVGLFAPEPAVGDFDYTAYLRAFETGARETLSPAEQIALANDFLGRVQWEQAKKIAATKPGPTTNTWLAEVRGLIAEEYPGFDGWVARAIWEKRPKPDEMIAELRVAVTDPEIAAADAGKGTILYLSALVMAEQMVVQLGGSTRHYQQAKSAEHIRDWLRSVAEQIKIIHPDFARVWTMTFERELADDEPPREEGLSA